METLMFISAVIAMMKIRTSQIMDDVDAYFNSIN